MGLSAEDHLRLNVLLSQNLKAVRIDESKMMVFALTSKGEAKIPLNPNCRDEKYIKEVKSLFSTFVMGSPGGYPVFLKRWTRMGQAKDESLSRLLLLGEEEAVVAAVHAPGLSDELAERAWWAMPTAENARKMLEKKAVVEGKTGPVLADFLIEFLPFEEEPHHMIESIRLVLQPGLISDEVRQGLWERAKSKRSYYVGFLQTLPDDLPDEFSCHPFYEELSQTFQSHAENGDPYARLLEKVFSHKGQGFVKTIEQALKKPSNQEVVVALFQTLEKYFSDAFVDGMPRGDMRNVYAWVDEFMQSQVVTMGLLKDDARLADYIRALVILSAVGVEMLNPFFSRTDAIGTGMRKKIKPVTDPIFQQLNILLQ